MAVGILPCIVLKAIILESYENRAVDVQTARLQNQCKILSDQIGAGGYADAQMPETLLVELTHLADVYNGRILLVNGQYEITEDTFDLDTGKILVSENVMQCFEGKETKIYDAKQRYIEVTCPVYAPDGSRVAGVLLTSIPADFVLESPGRAEPHRLGGSGRDRASGGDSCGGARPGHGAALREDHLLHRSGERGV